MKVDDRVQSLLDRRATGDNSPVTDLEWQARVQMVVNGPQAAKEKSHAAA